MNIHALFDDTDKIARSLDDRRLNKMVLETAQIICTAARMRNLQTITQPPYKPAFRKHPVVLWCAESHTNFAWTVRLFISYGKEYAARFQKTHKSILSLDLWLVEICDIVALSTQTPLSYHNSARNGGMQFDFTHMSTQLAYQHYLLARLQKEVNDYHAGNSRYYPRWTRVNPPQWIVNRIPDIAVMWRHHATELA